MAEVPREIPALVAIVTGMGLGDGGGEHGEERGGTGGKELHREPIQQEPFRFANKKVVRVRRAHQGNRDPIAPNKNRRPGGDGGERG